MSSFIIRWRLPLAVATGLHGIGHLLFLVPLLGIADWGQSTQSWLLSGSMGQIAAVAVGSLLWLIAIGGFTAVTLGLLLRTLRPRMAAYAALVSLAAIILFWGTPASSSAYYAALYDVGVLLVAWRLHFQPSAVIGA